MEKKKIKLLSDETLITLAGGEFTQALKDFKDGKIDVSELKSGPYCTECTRRGIGIRPTEKFIRRIFGGEFDHADGVAVGVSKVEG